MLVRRLLLVALSCLWGLSQLACDKKKPSSRLTAEEKAAHPRCRAQCKINGRCHWIKKQCRAKTETDCKVADVCKTSGLCSFRDGFCVAERAGDCRRSEQCRAAGACSFDATDPGRPCKAKTAADCQQSSGCRRHGRCSVYLGRCLVRQPGDCRSSEDCKRHGYCSPSEVSRPKNAPRTCVAASNEDCQQGDDCKKNGMCLAVDGRCR